MLRNGDNLYAGSVLCSTNMMLDELFTT